jgi:hypothetical protein
LVAGPRWVPDTKTDWPTGRNRTDFDMGVTVVEVSSF